ncbi:MAG: tRNA (adenosine(37)-N6)-dimethylallyltransferase MiaA [Bacteroidales bacterium]|jgi:tRNA dimethylallyltransferase|nr:tRNA (adenosine(37)-N6)-dimethylallyltransferase MiaA [Bacteroidales bacterium]
MKTLVVLTGPTGVGKTELSLSVAERLGSPIVNADSRQIYRELPIGTAAPTAAEQARVPHLFVGTHTLTDRYNAGKYEREALAALEELFRTRDHVLMVGGAMLYIDAVCKGLDEMPHVSAELREQVQQQYAANGLEWLQAQVKEADPQYFGEADIQNPQRLLHALEICLAGGRPYSSFRLGSRKERPFRVVKIGLTRPREELYTRINARVDNMLAQGLLEEVRAVESLRHLNALNTVGYKEMFRYLDGEWTLEAAADMVRQNSRHYAKRQLTWFNADPEMRWVNLTDTPEDLTNVMQIIQDNEG